MRRKIDRNRCTKSLSWSQFLKTLSGKHKVLNYHFLSKTKKQKKNNNDIKTLSWKMHLSAHLPAIMHITGLKETTCAMWRKATHAHAEHANSTHKYCTVLTFKPETCVLGGKSTKCHVSLKQLDFRKICSRFWYQKNSGHVSNFCLLWSLNNIVRCVQI